MIFENQKPNPRETKNCASFSLLRRGYLPTSVAQITIKTFRDFFSGDEAESDEREAEDEECLSHLELLRWC